MADTTGSATDPGRLDEQERRRLAALVTADIALLDDLHADDFVLINPGGGEWDTTFYLGGIADGSIDYRRFEAVTPIRYSLVAALRSCGTGPRSRSPSTADRTCR